MAISGFPVQEGDNLQSLSLNKTLVEMYLERYVGINGLLGFGSLGADAVGYDLVRPFQKGGLAGDNGGGLTVPESGAYVQALDIKTSPGFPINIPSGGNVGLGYLQQMTEQICHSYADTNAFPNGFNGLQYASGYTLASWRQSSNMDSVSGYVRKFPRTIQATSGIGTSGHRAYIDVNSDGLQSKTVYEYDGSLWIVANNQKRGPDIITSYGLMEQGDYIGPWIYNDLASGLLSLKWAKHSHIDVYPGVPNSFVTYESGIHMNLGGEVTSPDPWEDIVSSITGLYNSIDPYSYGIGSHNAGSGDFSANIVVTGSSLVNTNPTHGIPTFFGPSQLESVWKASYTEDINYASVTNLFASQRFLGITIPSGLIANIEVYGYFPQSGTYHLHDSTRFGGTQNPGEISSIYTEDYLNPGLHEIVLGSLELPVIPPRPISGPLPTGGLDHIYGGGLSRTILLNNANSAPATEIVLKYDNPSGFRYQ